jgi:hypothetical protein
VTALGPPLRASLSWLFCGAPATEITGDVRSRPAVAAPEDFINPLLEESAPVFFVVFFIALLQLFDFSGSSSHLKYADSKHTYYLNL